MKPRAVQRRTNDEAEVKTRVDEDDDDDVGL